MNGPERSFTAYKVNKVKKKMFVQVHIESLITLAIVNVVMKSNEDVPYSVSLSHGDRYKWVELLQSK